MGGFQGAPWKRYQHGKRKLKDGPTDTLVQYSSVWEAQSAQRPRSPTSDPLALNVEPCHTHTGRHAARKQGFLPVCVNSRRCSSASEDVSRPAVCEHRTTGRTGNRRALLEETTRAACMCQLVLE